MGCHSSKNANAGRPSSSAKSPGQSLTLLASPGEKNSVVPAHELPAKEVEQSLGSSPIDPQSSALAGAVGESSTTLPAEPTNSRTSNGTSLTGVMPSVGGSRAGAQNCSVTSTCSGMTSPVSNVSVDRAGKRHGTLQKQRTVCTEKNELDVMVVEFTSHDSTVGGLIGRNCKEMKWKVMYDREADPIDVKLHVQERKLHSNEVRIESNGQAIFHGAGPHAKTKMVEDFNYDWPFRATIRGINEPHFFELHPSHSNHEAWLPATITGQRADGHFEVTALEPDAGRIVERKYPAVDRASLREAASGKALAVPEDHLFLEVPKDNPLHAVLSLADGKHVTHHFGRPSPPPAAKRAELALKVSKDRSTVTADVGHSVLSHFVSGGVQTISKHAERLRHSWAVSLGPFAEHTIEITKKYTLGKIVTLMVDGEILVEASPADIGCEGQEWHCEFRFVGERTLDFEVFKTNVDGTALDETDHVRELRRYVHKCSVVIPNSLDFTTAQLSIDGSPFGHLPAKPPQHEDASVSMDPTVLLHSYGITVPYKVDHDAPSNIMALANRVRGKADARGNAGGGFFARCCDCSSVVKDGDEQQ